MFQHRHYKAIAALIADTQERITPAELAARFASFFASDNDRFNRERFIAACEGQPINGRDKVR